MTAKNRGNGEAPAELRCRKERYTVRSFISEDGKHRATAVTVPYRANRVTQTVN